MKNGVDEGGAQTEAPGRGWGADVARSTLRWSPRVVVRLRRRDIGKGGDLCPSSSLQGGKGSRGQVRRAMVLNEWR